MSAPINQGNDPNPLNLDRLSWVTCDVAPTHTGSCGASPTRAPPSALDRSQTSPVSVSFNPLGVTPLGVTPLGVTPLGITPRGGYKTTHPLALLLTDDNHRPWLPASADHGPRALPPARALGGLLEGQQALGPPGLHTHGHALRLLHGTWVWGCLPPCETAGGLRSGRSVGDVRCWVGADAGSGDAVTQWV